jgi:pyruvate/oxaloacetate carboxyltransferase
MYDFCPTMLSSHEFVLTSSSSQPSTLGVSLVLSEEIRANEVAIKKQRRAKQICEEHQKRFQKLYEKERQLEKTKQLYYRLPAKIIPLSDKVRAHQ